MRINGIKCSALLIALTSILINCHTVQQSKQQNASNSSLPSYPLQTEKDLDPLIKEIGNARIVLLGEASHGTEEYYHWRAAISKRLISEKGFNIIAVEGDWVDLYKLNKYIQGNISDSAALEKILRSFHRWPEWLWANYEIAAFVQWLNKHNQSLPANKKVGLYGLDLFAFSKALDELIPPLHDTALKAARNAQECLRPYEGDALKYSSAVSKSQHNCSDAVSGLWQLVQKNIQKIRTENDFLILQNAAVVFNGEKYFRTRAGETAESWNGRDKHMQETIRRLMQLYGANAKVIVWAHNTHVGDAHYTDMATRKRTNLGELLRNEYGEKNVFIVGSGSYTGELTSAWDWGGTPETIKLPPAKQGSWEYLLHTESATNKLLLSKELINNPRVRTWIEQRSIGVVYGPTYIPTIVNRRYDAFIYFDSSHALRIY